MPPAARRTVLIVERTIVALGSGQATKRAGSESARLGPVRAVRRAIHLRTLRTSDPTISRSKAAPPHRRCTTTWQLEMGIGIEQ